MYGPKLIVDQVLNGFPCKLGLQQDLYQQALDSLGAYSADGKVASGFEIRATHPISLGY